MTNDRKDLAYSAVAGEDNDLPNYHPSSFLTTFEMKTIDAQSNTKTIEISDTCESGNKTFLYIAACTGKYFNSIR